VSRLQTMLEQFLIASRTHDAPYLVDLKHLGLEGFIVDPDVLSPKYDTDSKFFPAAVAKAVGRGALLEIGAGTGIVSVYCQLQNGNSTVATDINPRAVQNCRDNVQKFGAAVDVRQGSLFEPLGAEEKFDHIFWNHPWCDSVRAKDVLEQAVYDFEYEALEQFLQTAQQHLKPEGRVLLGTSELADLDWINRRSACYGYTKSLVESSKQPVRDAGGKFSLVEHFLFAFNIHSSGN